MLRNHPRAVQQLQLARKIQSIFLIQDPQRKKEQLNFRMKGSCLQAKCLVLDDLAHVSFLPNTSKMW